MSKKFIRAASALIVVSIAVFSLLSFQQVTKRQFEKDLENRVLQVVTDIGVGSAIYLSKGLALSAAHVCELFPKAKTTFIVDSKHNQMRMEFYEVPSYSKENRVDLCLIKFTPKVSLPETVLSKEESIAIGTSLYNPSYGGGKYYSLNIGVVLADMAVEVPLEFCMPPLIPCENFEIYKVQKTSVPGVPGASGSGILDTDGKLVGILVIGPGDNSWSGIVPLEVIREFLNGSKLAALAEIN